jgi:hypothetical protein
MPMTLTEQPVQMKEIERLQKLLVTGIAENIEKAAHIYVKVVDKHPHAAKAIQDAVNFRHWGRLEAVARGALDPRLFFDFTIQANRLRSMPLTVQKNAIDNGVKVYIAEGEHLNVKLENLTRDQANQVFDGKNMRIRDEAAQRAYLESKKTTTASNTIPDYEWFSGKLKINRPMTPNEILRIIAEGAE